jgi:ankyrin repeat protein
MLLARAPHSAKARNSIDWLPLHLAASHGHTAACQLLLSSAPEVAVVADNDGYLPLHLAALHGHTGIYQLLLDRTPETVTARGRTALAFGCS